MSSEESLNKEFSEFFTFCEAQKFSDEEMKIILGPLVKQSFWKFCKRLTIVVVFIVVLIILYNYVDWFAWTLCAIGRLILIQVLPYWNWIPLYTSRCLIYSENMEENQGQTYLGRFETDKTNCVLCEKIEYIDAIRNTTFSLIENNYLNRGLPVLVIDSKNVATLSDFVENLNGAEDFVETKGCDVETNLMLKRLTSTAEILEKLQHFPQGSWFMQIRNCIFNAVKSSRLFITKPYFYPLHLDPFYSSWILISNNSIGLRKELYLHGLIIVQQLSGSLTILLSPKDPCFKNCREHYFNIDAGESLIFTTDLWVFSYLVEEDVTAITTIIEITWK